MGFALDPQATVGMRIDARGKEFIKNLWPIIFLES